MRTYAHKYKPSRQAGSAGPTRRERKPSQAGSEADAILQLQRSIGSRALQRLLRADAGSQVGLASSNAGPLRTIVERYPLHASIRRAADRTADQQRQPIPARLDAGPGQEQGGEMYRGLFEQLGAASAATAAVETSSPEATNEAAAPNTIKLPDIQVPLLAEIGKTDAINGGFKYSGSINKGGAGPTGFGVTRSFSANLKDITIASNSGTFDVAATFEHPITYQIRSGTGPDGQVDIGSETDPDITKTNYPTVVADLTPDTSDLNGRPPRTQFWAEDLTTKHELVHCADDQKNGPGAMATVTTWLNGQTAANQGEVNTLLGKLPGRFATELLAALSTEDGEKHAYGDGAPSYTARANAIKAKGDKGDYK